MFSSTALTLSCRIPLPYPATFAAKLPRNQLSLRAAGAGGQLVGHVLEKLSDLCGTGGVDAEVAVPDPQLALNLDCSGSFL